MHIDSIRSILPTLKTIEQLSVIFASLVVSVVSCNYNARQLATERYKIYREASIEMIENLNSTRNFHYNLLELLKEYKNQKKLKTLYNIVISIQNFPYKYNSFDIVSLFPQEISLPWTEFNDISLKILRKYQKLDLSNSKMTDKELTDLIAEINSLNQKLTKKYAEIFSKNSDEARKYMLEILD